MLDMAFCFLVNFSGIDSCNFFPNFQFFREVGLSSEHSSLANYGCEVVPGRGGSLGDKGDLGNTTPIQPKIVRL